MDPALAIELKAQSSQKYLNEAIDRGDSSVQKFYSNSTVFVTGGTGFLGKQLIEKLFRACNIGKLYVLIRPKKNKTVEDRLQLMLEDPVFDVVRKKYPNFANNIVPVAGDVANIQLGLSNDDWHMLTQEVNIIFHVAATTKFDEPLRSATLINVRGTRETLILGQQCVKLRCFVHVSTAYTNATDNNMEEEVLEKLYPCAIPPDTMIQLAENIDEQILKNIEKDFIKGYPNTYTFAKSIAEEEVRKYACKMPTCIVRPAIVVPSYKEPSPGWCDLSCVYSSSGLILGPASGLMHVIYGDTNIRFSMVPVDYVNNAVLVAGYETGVHGTNGTAKIYTVSSAKNLCSLNRLVTKFAKLGKELPTPSAIWYIFLLTTKSIPLFYILTWLLHYIPAYLGDAVCVLLGRKPRLVKLYHKMYRISKALSFFTTRSWIFNDSNTEKLYDSLSKSDKLIFNFDTSKVNFDEYMTLWGIGLRRYIIKDGLQNTEYAKAKQFWFHKLHILVSFLYVYSLWMFVAFVWHTITAIFSL